MKKSLDYYYEKDGIDTKISLYRKSERVLDTFVKFVLLLIIALVISVMWDVFAPNDKTLPYHEEPWLYIEGTHIDYKVMQGKDNFEYLDKNPYGEYYVGGSLFLDYRNDPDYKDEYNIIYGHNMDGGKMFGDLKKFYDKKFFDKHKKGLLYLESGIYDLEIVGVLNCDAYGNGIYHPRTINEYWEEEFKKCKYIRKGYEYTPGDKIIALSSCSTSMNDMRDVVFCKVKISK